MLRRLSVVLLATLAVAGCKKKEAAPPQAAGMQAPAQLAPSANALKGKIVERLDAEPYSYLKLATDKGEVWAAVPKTDKEKGAEVTVSGAMPMQDFESKTLKRKFEVVYFGTLGEPAAAMGAMPGGAEAPAPANIAA